MPSRTRLPQAAEYFAPANPNTRSTATRGSDSHLAIQLSSLSTTAFPAPPNNTYRSPNRQFHLRELRHELECLQNIRTTLGTGEANLDFWCGLRCAWERAILAALGQQGSTAQAGKMPNTVHLKHTRLPLTILGAPASSRHQRRTSRSVAARMAALPGFYRKVNSIGGKMAALPGCRRGSYADLMSTPQEFSVHFAIIFLCCVKRTRCSASCGTLLSALQIELVTNI